MKDIFSKRLPRQTPNSDSVSIKIAKLAPRFLHKYICGRLLSVFAEHGGLGVYRNAYTNESFKGIDRVFTKIPKVTFPNKSRFTIAFCVLGVFLGVFLSPAWLFLFLLLALLQWYAANVSEKTNIQYSLNPECQTVYRNFCKCFETLKVSQYVWLQTITAKGGEGRGVVVVGYGLPAGILSNVRYPCLKSKLFAIYFAPDGIIIQTNKRSVASGYEEFNLREVSESIHETKFTPKDAVKVGNRHEYLSANGQPDKRRKINREFPVNQYPVLEIHGAGMGFRIVASNPRGLTGVSFKDLIKSENFKASPASNLQPKPQESDSKDKTATHKIKAPSQFEETIGIIDAAGNMNIIEQSLNSEDHGILIRQSGLTAAIHSIPKPETINARSVQESSRFWMSRGEVIKIHGIEILGGMFYFNPHSSHDAHPSLIEGNTPIGRGDGDYRHNLNGYWPTYRGLQASDRRSYLNFLASDRADPGAGIGFVFLYFYGLERRLVIDAHEHSISENERLDLLAEVKRLVSVYGFNNSVKRYGSNLIQFVESARIIDPEFHQRILASCFERGAGLTNSKIPQSDIRIAIAQFAAINDRMPCDWAYLWAQQYIGLVDKSVTSYKPLFYKAFGVAFLTKYPDGMKFYKATIPLTKKYQSAASDIGGVELSIENLYDITASEKNIALIRELLGDVATLTESYWRIKRKAASSAFSVEPFLYLSADLWPSKLTELTARLLKKSAKPVCLSDVVDTFSMISINRQGLTRIYTRLAEQGVYLEPNVLQGAPTPKPSDPIVVFTHAAGEHLKPVSEAFAGASVFVELACAVSVADGNVSAAEIEQIHHRIDSWAGLSEFEHKCLVAKVTLLSAQTTTFAKLKAKLKLLPQEEIEHVAQLLAHVCGSDKTIDPKEVALLEKIFAALGIPEKLHEYLHTSSSASRPVELSETAAVSPSSKVKGSIAKNDHGQVFSLDFTRIARLQEETRHVATLLSSVFDQDESDQVDSVPAPYAVQSNSSGVAFDAFPALNAKQSQFLDLLLAQAQWSRPDLAAEASRLGLMLDGTLEVLNECAWDSFDEALTEGDAVIEVDQSLAKSILETKSN